MLLPAQATGRRTCSRSASPTLASSRLPARTFQGQGCPICLPHPFRPRASFSETAAAAGLPSSGLYGVSGLTGRSRGSSVPAGYQVGGQSANPDWARRAVALRCTTAAARRTASARAAPRAAWWRVLHAAARPTRLACTAGPATRRRRSWCRGWQPPRMTGPSKAWTWPFSTA